MTRIEVGAAAAGPSDSAPVERLTIYISSHRVDLLWETAAALTAPIVDELINSLYLYTNDDCIFA